MLRISAFFGIVIWMYYNDHQPPHFHAVYGEDEILIAIGSGDIMRGIYHVERSGLFKNGKNSIELNYSRIGNERANSNRFSRLLLWHSEST